MRPLLFLSLCLALSACDSRNPQDYYAELEKASAAPYERYYFGDPPSQLSATKNLISIMDRANPKTWEHMDWGSYASQVYGRASLAAELAGAKAEAAEYRRLAVLAWCKRKMWNNAYQKMLPVTPSLDFKPAEVELFTLIDRMDRAIRNSEKKEELSQPPQRNAGSRPFSSDSSASETSSSLGPRG